MWPKLHLWVWGRSNLACLHVLSDLVFLARLVSVVLTQAGPVELGDSSQVAAGEQLEALRHRPPGDVQCCYGWVDSRGTKTTIQQARWPPTGELLQMCNSHDVAADRWFPQVSVRFSQRCFPQTWSIPIGRRWTPLTQGFGAPLRSIH